MAFYTEKTLRRKADKIGYKIHKGPMRDEYGYNGHTGYMVADVSTNTWVLAPKTMTSCYDWDLNDVENFLRDEYKERGLEF